jgi:hypothetical protein
MRDHDGDCKKRLKISKGGISSSKDRQYNVPKDKKGHKEKNVEKTLHRNR